VDASRDDDECCMYIQERMAVWQDCEIALSEVQKVPYLPKLLVAAPTFPAIMPCR
jgi:hypothetical protein